MKVSNFKTSELESFYNSGETIFFNFRKVFVLDYSNNSGFFFYELISKRKMEGTPYTKRGKFAAMKPEWNTTKNLLNQ